MIPPVAVAAFAAVPIALANPTAVGLAAVRMSMIAFVVPFAFVYNNGILLSGTLGESVLACVTVTMATCLFLAAEGYWKRQLAPVHRLCFLVAGVGLMAPSYQVQIAAGVVARIGVLLVVRECLRQKGQGEHRLLDPLCIVPEYTID